MGQFARTLFRLLLGWVQTAMAWLWGLLTDADAGAWFRWMLEHWLALALALCIGGVLIDFVVYLIRWQPYRMWGRFLRREKAEPEEGAPEQSNPVYQRKWVYADGTTTVEEIREPLQPASEEPEPLAAPVRPMRRMARRASPEQAYNQPVYPPQWQNNTQDQQGENE